MNKSDLASRLARQSGIPKAAAADQLDQLVHEILQKLRKGRPASWPGLGTFLPGPKPAFRAEPGSRSGKRRK